MSMKLKELASLSDEELEKQYDKMAENTQIGLNYYTNEIMRRSNEKSNKTMITCTIIITIMTAIMTIATIITTYNIFAQK